MCAHVRAGELGISLVLGAEVTVGTEDRSGATDSATPELATHTPPTSTTCVLLATDRTGYANLCRLITTGRLRQPKGESRVTWPEVCARADGLIVLWGGDRCLATLTTRVIPAHGCRSPTKPLADGSAGCSRLRPLRAAS